MKNFEVLSKIIPLETEDTVDNFFSFFLINNILPFEAKYVSLKNKKDFTLVRKIVKYALKILKKEIGKNITYEEFLKNYFIPFYNNEILPYKKDYVQLLMEKNLQLIIHHLQNDPNFNNEFKNCLLNTNNKNRINKEKVEYLINLLENKLNISNSIIKESQLLIPNIKIHTNAQLYKHDLKFLAERFNEFKLLFKILEETLKKKKPNFLYKLNNPKKIQTIKTIGNLEYLYFVVMHEFLNFLAHYSMGMTYFCSPDNYKSNINKAISHLKRAIMDLLDVMIVEYNCSHLPEYLQIRTLKLASLGHKSKIKNIILSLQKIFEDCVCKKEAQIQQLCKELKNINNDNTENNKK